MLSYSDTSNALRWVMVDPAESWKSPREAEAYGVEPNVLFVPSSDAGEWTLSVPQRHADVAYLGWRRFWHEFAVDGVRQPIAAYPQDSESVRIVAALQAAHGQIVKRLDDPTSAVECACKALPTCAAEVLYRHLDRAAGLRWREWAPGWEHQGIAAAMVETAISIALDAAGAPLRGIAPPRLDLLVVQTLRGISDRCANGLSRPIAAVVNTLADRHDEVRDAVHRRLDEACGGDWRAWMQDEVNARNAAVVFDAARTAAGNAAGLAFA